MAYSESLFLLTIALLLLGFVRQLADLGARAHRRRSDRYQAGRHRRDRSGDHSRSGRSRTRILAQATRNRIRPWPAWLLGSVRVRGLPASEVRYSDCLCVRSETLVISIHPCPVRCNRSSCGWRHSSRSGICTSRARRGTGSSSTRPAIRFLESCSGTRFSLSSRRSRWVLAGYRGWFTKPETILGIGLLLIPYVTRGDEMSMGSQARFVVGGGSDVRRHSGVCSAGFPRPPRGLRFTATGPVASAMVGAVRGALAVVLVGSATWKHCTFLANAAKAKRHADLRASRGRGFSQATRARADHRDRPRRGRLHRSRSRFIRARSSTSPRCATNSTPCHFSRRAGSSSWRMPTRS